MNSDFENQLQRQPLREIPPHWRGRILAAAQPQSRKVWWRQWLAPWPKGWAALGAAWMAIFFFHFTTPEPMSAPKGGAMTVQSYAALQQETALMAQLLSSPDGAEPSPALPAKPQPRTERTLRQRIG